MHEGGKGDKKFWGLFSLLFFFLFFLCYLPVWLRFYLVIRLGLALSFLLAVAIYICWASGVYFDLVGLCLLLLLLLLRVLFPCKQLLVLLLLDGMGWV